MRSRYRVSTRRPPIRNSFQIFVPNGNSHEFGSDASMYVPLGIRIQRFLAAPSDHSGYCGVKGRFSAATARAFQSE